MQPPTKPRTRWGIIPGMPESWETERVRFDARDVPMYAEHCPSSELRVGETYFQVSYLDSEMLVPELGACVFIGRDLNPGDSGKLYFQDWDSYKRGSPYQADDGESVDTEGYVEIFLEEQSTGVFVYERALDLLLLCSVRRAALVADKSN